MKTGVLWGERQGRQQEHHSVLLTGLQFGILRILQAEQLPQVPSCGEHPQLSHGRMKSWGWVGQERGGRRHHPPDHTFSDSSLCFIIGCCLNDLLGHLLTVIGGN